MLQHRRLTAAVAAAAMAAAAAVAAVVSDDACTLTLIVRTCSFVRVCYRMRAFIRLFHNIDPVARSAPAVPFLRHLSSANKPRTTRV